jgi:hypothetical protein
MRLEGGSATLNARTHTTRIAPETTTCASTGPDARCDSRAPAHASTVRVGLNVRLGDCPSAPAQLTTVPEFQSNHLVQRAPRWLWPTALAAPFTRGRPVRRPPEVSQRASGEAARI